MESLWSCLAGGKSIRIKGEIVGEVEGGGLEEDEVGWSVGIWSVSKMNERSCPM